MFQAILYELSQPYEGVGEQELRLRLTDFLLQQCRTAGGAVLILDEAQHLTPDLLGGGKSVMIGNLIQNQFTTARDWPFGAAVSLALMAVVMLLLAAFVRRREEGLL